ncbi:hypothetical protein [Arthrobacter sp. FW306-04-A]|uniref:hypothetical protein n=1 Tax=Arthrobacter sp. FW306-04-A TaxID=2879619 RepID=UPI0037BEE885|nr:hypothetical protein LFT43_17290 [Arthrobacter sp. FW306-04-A]
MAGAANLQCNDKDHTKVTHADGLRAWAKGSFPCEAATELLLRGFGGRFAAPGNPWIGTDEFSGASWIDFASIPEYAGRVSNGEWGFLMFAASMAEGVPVNLAEIVTVVNRESVALLLASIAHASGSHEHSWEKADRVELAGFNRLPGLYSWPGKHAEGR